LQIFKNPEKNSIQKEEFLNKILLLFIEQQFLLSKNRKGASLYPLDQSFTRVKKRNLHCNKLCIAATCPPFLLVAVQSKGHYSTQPA